MRSILFNINDLNLIFNCINICISISIINRRGELEKFFKNNKGLLFFNIPIFLLVDMKSLEDILRFSGIRFTEEPFQITLKSMLLIAFFYLIFLICILLFNLKNSNKNLREFILVFPLLNIFLFVMITITLCLFLYICKIEYFTATKPSNNEKNNINSVLFEDFLTYDLSNFFFLPSQSPWKVDNNLGFFTNKSTNLANVAILKNEINLPDYYEVSVDILYNKDSTSFTVGLFINGYFAPNGISRSIQGVGLHVYDVTGKTHGINIHSFQPDKEQKTIYNYNFSSIYDYNRLKLKIKNTNNTQSEVKIFINNEYIGEDIFEIKNNSNSNIGLVGSGVYFKNFSIKKLNPLDFNNQFIGQDLSYNK